MVKKRQGMVLDATGQRIGIATDNADGGIDVRSSIPRSQVREPVEHMVGDDDTEDGVAEKLGPFVAGLILVLGAP